ncbi:unnamed protein product, partial [Prorocentrum cordatum]
RAAAAEIEGESARRGKGQALLAAAPAQKHLEAMSLEGLCALTGACARLRALGGPDGADGAALAAALGRVQRSGFRLAPAHLGHLLHSFGRWHQACRQAMDAATESLVSDLFRSTLRPAVLRTAPAFARPQHVAFAAAGLAGAGCRGREELLPLEALAALLLGAQVGGPAQPLHWDRFCGRDLAVLAEAFGEAAAAGPGADPSTDGGGPVADLLESMASHLLGPAAGTAGDAGSVGDANVGRLGALEASAACRLAGAFCWAPRGVEICQAAAARVLEEPVGGLASASLARLLRAMGRLQLRQGALCGGLLWLLHQRLWGVWGAARAELDEGAAGADELLIQRLRGELDVPLAAAALVAAERLGCFDAAATQEEARPVLQGLLWGALALARGEAARAGERAPGRHLQMASVLRCVALAAAEVPLGPEWQRSVAEHLEFAVAVLEERGALPLRAQEWCGLSRALCRLAVAHRGGECEAPLRRAAARLSLHGPAEVDGGSFGGSEAALALAGLAEAGFDARAAAPTVARA